MGKAVGKAKAKQRTVRKKCTKQAKIKSLECINDSNNSLLEITTPNYEKLTIENEIMMLTAVLLSRTLRCKVFDERRCVFLGEEKPIIIEIGNRLNDLGGFELMADVYDEVKKLTGNKYGDMRELKCAWDGIGEWKS